VRWVRPSALLLLGGAVLAAWVGFHVRLRAAGTFTFSRGADLAAVRPGLLARLATLPQALRVVALALLAVALARPQSAAGADDLEVEGIDLVVTLDLSNSMEESDIVPDRLTAAKRVIDDFIARRRSDRIGLVVFGREAFTQCPPTLDHAALRSMLGELHFGVIDGRGTAIGNGLAVALNRLRHSDTQSKAIILLTDGDNNAGNLSPLQAAAFAQRLGVKVFTILVGQIDPGGATSARRRYPVNPALLEQIAAMTGGTPYLATDERALAQRFHQILEELDRSKLRERGVLYAEVFPSFLWPALGLLLVEVALSLTRWRKLP
jgi:Ca-activated chloride channel family protein